MTIPGQEPILDRLREAAGRDNLHHAYLLVGPPGLGQVDAALWLAQLSNCEADSGRPCGVCRNCHLIAARNHPDVTWVIPLEKSKAGKITIDQAREIRTEVSRRPVIGRHRLVIFAPADELTLDAVNCLLKTLEEPPDYATLVLIATDTANVPATVLSRCQVVRFKPVPLETLAPFLVENGADPQTAERLAVLSEGRPGEALRLLREPEALAARDRVLDWLERVANALPADALRLAEEMRSGTGEEKPDAANTIHWAVTWFRDIMALQSGTGPEIVLNQDRLPALERAADVYPMSQVGAAVDALVQTRRYLAGNANAALTLEVLLMDLIPGEAGR